MIHLGIGFEWNVSITFMRNVDCSIRNSCMEISLVFHSKWKIDTKTRQSSIVEFVFFLLDGIMFSIVPITISNCWWLIINFWLIDTLSLCLYAFDFVVRISLKLHSMCVGSGDANDIKQFQYRTRPTILVGGKRKCHGSIVTA